MDYFVDQDSVVRKVWGKGDTVLFIFAGASAEFALNKAVDWLYFTGRLPADPLGRLFSTMTYARQIIFSEESAAIQAIDKINSIHQGVEKSRGSQIPDWAYRDVLFLLIDYSIRSFEVLERRLDNAEKEDIFQVFYRVGLRMGLTGLPVNYTDWLSMRQEHLRDNLLNSNFTVDLYQQYQKHLGPVRYQLLKQVQLMIVPEKVKHMLKLNQPAWLIPVLWIYKLTRLLKINTVFRNALLPGQYKARIQNLDLV